MLDGESTPIDNWRLMHVRLDRVTGELSERQWALVRDELRDDHAIAKHTPADFYRLASKGCPHNLPAMIDADAASYDDDPDGWLERTGVADEHFYDEDGELYCKSLVADEAGCEECETCPCMLPAGRLEKRSNFWWDFSHERRQLKQHDAGAHKERRDDTCAMCDTDAWIAGLDGKGTA